MVMFGGVEAIGEVFLSADGVFLEASGAHLVFADLDGFGGIFLAVKVDIVDGVFLLHSIIHVNDLQNKRGQFTKYQDYNQLINSSSYELSFRAGIDGQDCVFRC